MNSVKTLRSMPPVFSLQDMAKLLDKDHPAVKANVARWKEQGLVRAVGPRLGLYYNLVTHPNWEENRALAVKMAYPSAIVIGPTVLHRHGWITQIPQSLSIAVLNDGSHPSMEGVEVFKRSMRWYRKFSPWGEPIYGLPALTPENALLDCMENASIRLWCPNVDDLDEFEVPESLLEMVAHHDEHHASRGGQGQRPR
ncbi:hypothetical protein K2O51_31805 (plasmid) [Cupriavidus pinatubonensis]|uniref:hypothetical protein n=1 Tax=Cupriavidus pinatubonensis TaxID=248026 RepID=UPI001C73288E|nr:hypothetical protein [Cupriavidus pinatubonensis]QYY33612.1 hypothetical protein K2O51_31805 [Cupriavidus pinatubonensis]